MADFLDTPSRQTKPRSKGLTHVIDTGLSLNQVNGLLELAAELIDIVKLGWGTGYVTGPLKKKVAIYQDAGIPVVIGGTLGEVALQQDKFNSFVEWIKGLGLKHIEISSGTIDVARERKLELITQLAGEFTVLSEVGSKDPAALVAPFRWVQEIGEELEAGAEKVILEARESGTAGVYRPNGEIRMGLIEEVKHHLDIDSLVFEAPRKEQQAWLINHLGPEVNLGNISTNDVIALETLRLGLRADTVSCFI